MTAYLIFPKEKVMILDVIREIDEYFSLRLDYSEIRSTCESINLDFYEECFKQLIDIGSTISSSISEKNGLIELQAHFLDTNETIKSIEYALQQFKVPYDSIASGGLTKYMYRPDISNSIVRVNMHPGVGGSEYVVGIDEVIGMIDSFNEVSPEKFKKIFLRNIEEKVFPYPDISTYSSSTQEKATNLCFEPTGLKDLRLLNNLY
ncbi:hypothetical protein MOF23_07175 [Bacillus inaquosorum]|uniref:hypothetical protein n=1 Tax=Bacillus inaquosorum TaxID=483913 RepID=UPI0022831ABC|nr:hypothetical protein [Bacillus inaquosorum]MCY9308758.1 hypothetical protein [Bacillus inaquosorum]